MAAPVSAGNCQDSDEDSYVVGRGILHVIKRNRPCCATQRGGYSTKLGETLEPELFGRSEDAKQNKEAAAVGDESPSAWPLGLHCGSKLETCLENIRNELLYVVAVL